MSEDKIEFVRFGTKPRENRTYALDSKGVVWVSTGNIEWESVEAVPRHIKQGLTTGQLMQLIQQQKARVS
jgi:hypothetical protein